MSAVIHRQVEAVRPHRFVASPGGSASKMYKHRRQFTYSSRDQLLSRISVRPLQMAAQIHAFRRWPIFCWNSGFRQLSYWY